MPQLIAVVSETTHLEKRVALTPNQAAAMIGLGFEVGIESGAGDAAGFLAEAYEAVGVTVYRHKKDLLGACQILLKSSTS